jgi:hypothetical protein
MLTACRPAAQEAEGFSVGTEALPGSIEAAAAPAATPTAKELAGTLSPGAMLRAKARKSTPVSRFPFPQTAVHQAGVEVEESGTVAAAATGRGIGATVVPPPLLLLRRGPICQRICLKIFSNSPII